MPRHDIIVIGASAGGVEALARLARDLPADLPAAVFVVLHFPADGNSVLHRILNHAGPLPAVQASDGEPVQPGRIYVSQPDHHLMIDNGRLRVVRGPRENGHRPSVDPLFRSAARAYGSQVIGVVLTGHLDDGTAGLMAIKQRGGLAVVQDPRDAFASGMPTSALQHIQPDHCVPLDQIGALLVSLVKEEAPKGVPPVRPLLGAETKMAEFDLEQIEAPDNEHPGDPSAFGCPECHGVLWEVHDGAMVRFRCRVGHAYSPNTLLVEQSTSAEAALWAAMRALEEKASLTRRLAERAGERGQRLATESFERRALEAEKQAGAIRELLLSGDGLSLQEPALFDTMAWGSNGSKPTA